MIYVNYVFKEEFAAAYGKPGHKPCLGRGYYIIQYPRSDGAWMEEKRYCDCVYRQLEKIK